MSTISVEPFAPAVAETLALLSDLPGTELRMAALYGSAAREDFDPGQSDVNLLLVFNRLPDLAFLAEVLQRARSRYRCAPLVLSASDLARSLEVFPVKVLEIQRRYRMLAGEDLLAGLKIEFEPLRRACEHDLRNAQLKLRRTYLLTRPDPRPLQDALRRFLPQIIGALRCLLDHAGATDLGTFEGLRAASESRLALDLGPLEQALALRHRPGAPWPEVSQAFETVSGILAGLLIRVMRLEGL